MAEKLTDTSGITDLGGDHGPRVVPGSLASLDTTLPPTPLKKLLAAEGAGVCVYSTDAELTATIESAAGEQYPVATTGDWDELTAEVATRSCHIILLDSDTLTRDVAESVAELRGIDPSIVILLAAPRELAQSFVSMLADRSVHRLLIKPAAIAITRLMLESAVSRYLQVREQIQTAPAVAQTASASALPAEHSRSTVSWVLLAACGGVCLVAGMLLAPLIAPWQSDAGLAAGPGAAVEARTNGAADGGGDTADDGSSSGAAAMPGAAASPGVVQAGGAPAGAVPAGPGTAEPGSATAAETARTDTGRTDTFLEQAEAALAAGDLRAASELIDEARALDASSARVAVVQAELDALLTEQAATDAASAAAIAAAEAPAPEPAPPSELDSMLALARARLEDGQIVAPPENNALAFLRLAEAIAPESPDVVEFRQQLAAVVVVRSRLALEGDDVEAAQTLFELAGDLNANAEDLALLDTELSAVAQRSAAEEARLAGLLADALVRGNLTGAGSAAAYLEQLGSLNPANARLADLQRQLLDGIADQASDLLAGGRLDDANQLIGAAGRIDPSDDRLTVLRADYAAATRQRDLLQTPAGRGEVTLIEAPPAEYPRIALEADVEGWVELEFVIDRAGVPGEIRVSAAEPEGWFEDTAIAALTTYRYEPYREGDRTYSRLARIRMGFALE